jgi:hypothetical protein
MDDVLAKYRDGLRDRANKKIPEFAPEAVHTAPILALLLDPGKSGATKSGIVQVHNDDPTARRTLEKIERAKLKLDDFVLWNFYASFDVVVKKEARDFWEGETERLIKETMKKLKVVLVFGNDAWLGMRGVELPKCVVLIGAPHPSQRSVNSDKSADGKIERAWARAKHLIDGCEK